MNSFKKIAIVIAAALTSTLLPITASTAAAPAGVVSTLSANASAVQIGETASTTITTSGIYAVGDTTTTTVAITSWPAGATNASLAGMISPTLTAIDTATADVVTTSNGQVVQTTAGVISPVGSVSALVSGRTKISVTPSSANTAGTYVYTVTTVSNASPVTTLSTLTWTVTVAASALKASTVFIGTSIGTAPTSDATTLSKVLTTDGVAEATAVAQISVKQWQDVAGTVAMNSSYTKSVEVSIASAGVVGSTNSTSPLRGAFVSTPAAIAGVTTSPASQDYWVYADGRTGKATITVKIDGVVVATKYFTFTGKLATLSATASKKNVGVGETLTLTAAGADVNANATATPTVTAASSDATIATVTASGAVATVTGVKAGTATITLTSGTVTLAVPVTVLPVTAKTLSWAFDKDSYESGEKITLIITAAGVADGARATFVAAPVANFNVATGSDTLVASPTFIAGVATYTLYAPATPGKFTLTAGVGAAVDTEAVIIAAGGTRTVATLSTTVTNPALTAAQEATDAAKEATAAGNNAKDAADQAIEAADAATIAAQDAAAAAEKAGELAVEAAEAAGAIAKDALDAANAATNAALSAAEAADAATVAATEAKESADAATAAVAALSAEVAKLMAALNKKITTLSNLVAKIAKKVKA
jgi:trimeric autotransporter adhesin